MKLVMGCFLVLCVLVATPEFAKAGFIAAIDFTGTGNGGGSTADNYTYGTQFTTGGTAFIVDAVAVLNPGASGQTVRIYENGTTQNLVTMAIPSNSSVSSATVNGHTYQYQAITPLLLMPNTTYDIVEDAVTGSFNYLLVSGQSENGDITFDRPVISSGTGGFPTTDAFGDGAYFGPSFEGQPQVATVSEPSMFVLTCLAAAGLGVAAWRKRNKAQAAGQAPAQTV